MFGATPTALNDGKGDAAVSHIRRTTQNLLTIRNRMQDKSIKMDKNSTNIVKIECFVFVRHDGQSTIWRIVSHP